MHKLNITPAACVVALAATSALALPAQAGDRKAMLTWIKSVADGVIDVPIPAGNDFNVYLSNFTALDPTVTSIDFTITYNPQVVSSEAFVVNSDLTLSNFKDATDPSGGPDDLITFTLQPNPGETWDPVPLDLAVFTYRGHTRDNSATADIALNLATGRDQFNNPVTVATQDAADAQRIFIIPAPEPASLGLLALGAAPLVLRKRRD